MIVKKNRVSFFAKRYSLINMPLHTFESNPANQNPINLFNISLDPLPKLSHRHLQRAISGGRTKQWLNYGLKTEQAPQLLIKENHLQAYPIDNERTGNENDFCTNCGNLVDEKDKFCIFCGSRLQH
jgi:ribosomal protein S27AE